MKEVALVAVIPLLMWLGQSAILLAIRRPLRLRLGSADLPPAARMANRVAGNVAIVLVLAAYPFVRGEPAAVTYGALFPRSAAERQLAFGLAAAAAYLSLLYVAWIATDNLRIEVRHRARRIARRLAVVPLMAAMAALVEELLFRGVLLRGLLESTPVSVALGSTVLIFALAHYVRSVKRYWTFAGHVALGLLLSVAFLATGNLWLPVGLHAGGVLLIMGLRPFVRYRGPAWLVGASIFPYSGAVGVAALLALTLNVWLKFGR